MDTELRSPEIKSINDPAGKMLFKNSKGLEILNQCTGIHSQKFEIKTSTRIEYTLNFPTIEDESITHKTWVVLDVDEEDGKDVITLALQINNEAIIVEKVYIDDSNSIEKMSQRVSNLIMGLANGREDNDQEDEEDEEE